MNIYFALMPFFVLGRVGDSKTKSIFFNQKKKMYSQKKSLLYVDIAPVLHSSAFSSLNDNYWAGEETSVCKVCWCSSRRPRS